jgi:hypothetical protein
MLASPQLGLAERKSKVSTSLDMAIAYMIDTRSYTPAKYTGDTTITTF